MDSTTDYILAFIGLLGSLIGIVTGLQALKEWLLAKRIIKSSKASIPIFISKSISFSQFKKSHKVVKDVLVEDRFAPEVVLGIHYSGTEYGSIVAKEFYVPILTAVTHYITQHGVLICDKVYFNFEPEAFLRNKKVLIVDNSATTGRTLKLTFDAVQPYTTHVRTLIWHQKTETSDMQFKPDYSIFQSKEKIALLR